MVKKKHRLLAAALSIVMVLGLAPANAWAADGELPAPQAPEAHSHPICGAACSGHDDTHVPVNWTPFSLADGGELTTGCYYLNVTVSDDVADQPLTGQTSATLDTSGLADGKYLCRVSWADGESVDSEPVDYTARQPAPALGEGYDIDYGAETITVEPGYEVNSKNDGTGEAIVTGDVSDYFGKIIYIRREETDTQGRPTGRRSRWPPAPTPPPRPRWGT